MSPQAEIVAGHTTALADDYAAVPARPFTAGEVTHHTALMSPLDGPGARRFRDAGWHPAQGKGGAGALTAR
ncbi:hypothetical protein [Streptomyces avermitilis]|uniref:hypothetical protein n=1 Tax=Streptomyces avermitilis TaxID=33903 RepID=UPI00368A87F3